MFTGLSKNISLEVYIFLCKFYLYNFIHVFLSYSYLEIWNLMSIQDFRAFLEYGSLRIHPSPYQNTPVKYLLAL